MSLRSAFPQFGGKSPSRTPRMAVMCNPSRADLPHRVHAPGCAGHTDRHRALFLRLTADAGFSQPTISRSHWVSDCHSPLTPLQESWVAMDIRQQRFAEAVLCLRLVPLQPQSIAAISSCFPFFFSTLLAWHSLGLKPCARRLVPLCFAQRQRSLRVSAPPPTFPICRRPGSRKSCRSPEKARPQAWEQQPLALRVPKPNGQKRSN